MKPLYEDPHFTFRFAEDWLIPRFHLEGIQAGRQVKVYKIDTGTRCTSRSSRTRCACRTLASESE